MKKKGLILTALLLFAFTAIDAQNKTKLFVMGGYNRTDVTSDKGRGTPNNSVFGGLLVDWAGTEYFSLQTGAFFMPKGYKSYNRYEVDFPYKIRAYYLEIPLLVAYKLPINKDFKLVIDGGLYYAIGLFGKLKMDNQEVWKTSIDIFGKDRDPNYEQWERYDIGVQAGVGFELYDRIKLRVNFEQGLVKLLKYDDINRFNQSLGVSLGYSFF